MKVDSILFDLDGTMWDSTEPAAVIWREVAAQYPEIKDEVTGPKLKRLYGLPLEDIARGIFTSVPEKRAIEIMEECVKKQCPYLANVGGILLGDVEGTLDKLIKKGYRLFIISNCKSGYIESFLEAHKLQKYFEDIMCPGDTGRLKADNIRIMMKRHDLKNPVYVGDTEGDGMAARTAGVPFIYAAYGFGTTCKYNFAINSFEELCTEPWK